jgi:putative intracellular protease/amidase
MDRKIAVVGLGYVGLPVAVALAERLTVRGVRVTGSPGIKDDLMNAGAIWEDAPVVVDRHFVSSRKPADLPAFMAAIVDHLAAAVTG